MDDKSIVIINGRSYDALTGLPIEEKKKPAAPSRHAAPSGVHKTQQRSQILNRRLARKGRPPKPAAKPSTGKTMDIARSAHASKFAPKVAAAEAPKKSAGTPDAKPSTHPIARRAMERHHALRRSNDVSRQKTSKQIKEDAIQKALNTPSITPEVTPGFFRRHSRKVTAAIIAFIVLGVGGYLVYTNLPVLSVSFASSQAGISASYPGYTPNGYHLEQPITFSDGEVKLEFSSNTGSGEYVITQSRSSWDSSAVLSNVVQQVVEDDYVVTQDGGLTIYSYQGNAAWVNGGILYVIETKAPLSGDQIRSIATSL
jgi:hypothetical protein